MCVKTESAMIWVISCAKASTTSSIAPTLTKSIRTTMQKAGSFSARGTLITFWKELTFYPVFKRKPLWKTAIIIALNITMSYSQEKTWNWSTNHVILLPLTLNLKWIESCKYQWIDQTVSLFINSYSPNKLDVIGSLSKGSLSKNLHQSILSI